LDQVQNPKFIFHKISSN